MQKVKPLILSLLFMLSTLLPVACFFEPPARAESLRITGAKVYTAPGIDPIASAEIAISDGRIVSIDPSSKEMSGVAAERRIDAEGLVAVAGLWNCHVHFTEPHWLGAADKAAEDLEAHLRSMLTRYGFTAVVDAGSAPLNTLALRSRIDAGLRGPEIYLYSGNFVAVGGSPAYLEVKLPELDSRQRARALTSQILDLGVDGIKIFTGSYLGEGRLAHLDVPLVQAVTETVHARGGWVLSHPQSRRGIDAAIEGGVDVLTHTAPDSGPWDAELVERLIRADIGVIPTLKLWRYELARLGRSAREVEGFQRQGVEQLRAFADAGGEVLFGTDVGYMTDYDPLEEYRKMHEAGLDLHRLLAALTTAPAKRFRGDTKRASTLEVGQPGDVVLLGSDPAETPAAFADVRYTIRAGRVIYSSE